MKSDTERKRYHREKLHKRKRRMRVHLSKELRGKLKVKRRAFLLRKGDTVRIMRGPHKGKEGKVGAVDTQGRKVIVEGIVVKNARGKEVGIPLQPSNLLLLSLEPTPERKKIFAEDAFKKKEPPKKAKEEAKEAEEKPAAPVKEPPKSHPSKGPEKPAPKAQTTQR